MTGRGVDQILPHASHPALHEAYVKDARDYVALAEEANGPIAKPADYAYIWGDALTELERAAPQARIVPLETSLTTSADRQEKGVNYRMHPANVPCLTAARPDVCVLSNNHVMDFGYRGLVETLGVLHRAGIRTAGAGRDLAETQAPAIVPMPGSGRVLVYGFGHESSGIPLSWAATRERGGVNLVTNLSLAGVEVIATQVRPRKRPGDVVVASVHWGDNWGYAVPAEQRAFAHALIDRAGVDVVHGHSSHHAKGIEVYRDRLVLYGCGDLLNDYEGIRGYEDYRGDLGFMYFPTLDARGQLLELRLVPTRIRHLRVNRADAVETRWLSAMLDREGRGFGTRAEHCTDGSLRLVWS